VARTPGHNPMRGLQPFQTGHRHDHPAADAMSALGLFATVALAHGLAVMSPGPDFAVVTQQTLRQGRAAGLWTAAGIACGIVFHVGYGLFGLGWLIARLPWLLMLLQGLGGLFLLYLGLSALRSAPVSGEMRDAARATSSRQAFRLGLLTNLLNPKAALFFVSLFAAVVGPQTALALKLLLALWIIGSTYAWFAFVAMTLGAESVRMRLLRHGHWIDRITGVVLLLLAVALLGAVVEA